jgi:monothiol bacilliredoxin
MSQPDILRSTADLEPVLDGSQPQPTFVFKHSLTCPISSAAYSEYLRFVRGEGAASGAAFKLIEIQNSRPVSNHVAEATGIRHESPQAILFVAGQPVWHASHHRITTRSLADALAKAS